jgi:hypothetical protein
MRRFCMGIAGALLVFTLTGCGETVDEGPKAFTGTPPSAAIDALRDNQGKAVKAGDHKKSPPAETTKPSDAKTTDVKAVDSKPPEKKKD